MIKWFKRRTEKAPETAADSTEGEDQGIIEEEGPEEPSFESFENRDRTIDDVAAESIATSESEISDWSATAEDDQEPPKREKLSYFRRLRERLHHTREQFVSRVDRLVLGRKTIDIDLLDQLEEVLITSDLGVKTTQALLQKLTDSLKRQELKDPSKLRQTLTEEIRRILSIEAPAWNFAEHHPFIVMVVGVNGVGKTTTIGKLARILQQRGLSVLLVAADTFRAAAIEQLVLWGERVGVPVIRQKSGSDPSAVAFDALDAAVARNVDVVILDTAGRMHTKVNLMEELKKIQRVIKKKIPSAPHETLLILDASTGQNAVSQVRLFKDEVNVTGLILTKLDGTAKGGIIVAICEEFKLPVRYIGIGEGLDDLRPFDPEEFTKALF